MSEAQLGEGETGDSATLASEHTYESSWRQPEDVDRWIREEVADRFTLNLCAGKSPIGDVKVDADPQQPEAIPADMRTLPFEESTFEAVVFDPPWKLGYYKRQKPFFEAVRVTEPGGIIIMNALWVGDSDQATLEETVLRADDEWANVSALTLHTVEPGQESLDTWGGGADVETETVSPYRMVRCRNCGNTLPESQAVVSETLGDPFCSPGEMWEVEAHFHEPLTHVPNHDPELPPGGLLKYADLEPSPANGDGFVISRQE
jgi:hypothetical protein